MSVIGHQVKLENIEIVGPRDMNQVYNIDGSDMMSSHDLQQLQRDEVSEFEILKQCTECEFSSMAPSLSFNRVSQKSGTQDKVCKH